MRLVPKDTAGKIQFYRTHLAQWALDPAGIGTTPAQVAELDARVAAATDAYRQQQMAQDAAMSATLRLHEALAEMANTGADIIEQVRCHARSAGPAVYPQAHIPPLAAPSPKPAPGKPSGFTVELQQIGTLALRWKCKNPADATGTMYQVWRKIGAREFEYLGTSGVRRFVDQTLPPGATGVLYKIQAVRSTAVGPCAVFLVNFGVDAQQKALLAGQTKVAA